MIGLIILLVAGTYFAIWGLVVYFSYRLTFKATESKKKSFSVATVFFVVMYLIPFWDLIPVLVMHKKYCNAEAGFWVYKTPEDWIAENPEVAKSLENYEKSNIKYPRKGHMKFFINDRFVEEIDRSTDVFHAINREDMIFLDIDNEQVLIKRTDFRFGSGMASIPSGGSLEGWRRFFVFIWFDKRTCTIESDISNETYLVYRKKFRSIGEIK